MTDIETKMALQLCQSAEDFDTILNQTWCRTDEDKIEYLKQLFNVAVVQATDNKHTDYLALMNTIMKWY